jgi:protein-disulfide isomerase
MNFKQISTTVVALTLCFTAERTFATPKDTPSPKVDWQVQNEWKIPSTPVDIAYSLDQKHVFVLTKQHTVIVYNHTGQIEGSIPVSPGVSAIDIAPRGEYLYLIDSEKNTFSSLIVDFIVDINITDSPSIGKENAPITIVEFSDFECPYCSQVTPLLEQVVAKNPDTVRFVFKNLPLRSHQFADLAARAALAAKEQGKFWEFYKELFSTQKLNSQTIEAIAVKLQLDMVRYKQDMVSPKIEQKIVQDIDDAEKAGVNSTPTIFINGKALRIHSFNEIQQLIDRELKTLKAHH